MAVETAADRASMCAASDWGSAAIYKSANKRYPVQGIFDREYVGVNVSDVEFASTLPAFHFPTASLPCRATVGDTLYIDDDVYTIRNIENDGTGITRLRLEATE